MPIILSAVDQAPPLWVSLAPGAAPALVPGGPPAAPVAAMLARLERHAITQFGWQNGCVLEAHSALAEHDPARWRQAWERAMAPYLRADGLHFQSARGLPLNNRLTTIESTLPWASLAQFAPTHPANTLGLDFWHAHQSPPGLIADGQTLSAEGCYTVAYPLMAQARLRQDEALAELAVSQLRHRRLALIHDGDLYLRGSPTARTFRNWCRGICWYLLGQTQTLLASGTPAQWPDLLAHLAERASWIASYQRPDGLWSNFLEDPQLPPDCSGSAGIATALLRASQAGLVAQDYRPLAERCWAGLMPYLTSDGWLTGCGPNNKRDEAHQRRPRRSTPVFGLGLAGQLLAALGKDQA